MALEDFDHAARKWSKPSGDVQRVFILRSRIGRNIYVMRDDALEITSRLFGTRHEQRIPIRTISPEYGVRGTRLLRVVTLLLLPVAACIIALRLLARIPHVPDEMMWFPAEIGAVYLIAAIRFIPRFEWFEFKDHFGRTRFTILREPAQREECDAFIHALLDRIEGIEENSEEGSNTAPESIPPTDREGIPRWKLAVGLSLFAIVVPPAARAMGESSDFFVIVPLVIGTGGSIVSAFYSHAWKERRRVWAFVAAAAALWPLLFY